MSVPLPVPFSKVRHLPAGTAAVLRPRLAGGGAFRIGIYSDSSRSIDRLLFFFARDTQ